MQQRSRLRLLLALAGGLSISAAVPVLSPTAAFAAAGDQTQPRVMERAIQQSEATRAAPARPAFTPRPLVAATPSSRPLREVFGYANAGNLGDPGVGYTTWNFSLISTVAYFGLVADGNGNIVQSGSGWTVWNSSTGSGLIDTAHRSGARVVISLVEHDSGLCSALVNSQNTVNQVLGQLHGADGVNVDYEGVNGSCGGSTIRALTTRFMQQLRAAMPGGYLSIATYASSAADPGGMFEKWSASELHSSGAPPP